MKPRKKENSKQPTHEDIQALLNFLPVFKTLGFDPVVRWHGGDKDKNGVIHMPFPEYDPNVGKFFHLASSECWCDYEYTSSGAGKMVRNKELIQNASLAELKSLLTYCVRGERFGDGVWEDFFNEGIIQSILERLKIICENKNLSTK